MAGITFLLILLLIYILVDILLTKLTESNMDQIYQGSLNSRIVKSCCTST